MFIMFHLYHALSSIGASNRARFIFFKHGVARGDDRSYVSITDCITKATEEASKDLNCSREDHKPSPSTCCIIKSFCNHTKTLLTQEPQTFPHACEFH